MRKALNVISCVRSTISKNQPQFPIIVWFLVVSFVALHLPNIGIAADSQVCEYPGVATLHSAIITNGTVSLGVADEGHLNVDGGAESAWEGTTVVGVRYLPTNGEAIAPGCLCEGWGVADYTRNESAYSTAAGGVGIDMSFESFVSTDSEALSSVIAFDRLRVVHYYHPTPLTKYLYAVDVTIENISDTDVSDLRYTRSMDWDIPPTPFHEYVTIEGMGYSDQLIYVDDNGFTIPDPLGSRTPELGSGNQKDSGPSDHGALFDFAFGELPVGQSKSFRLYYGAAGNEVESLHALQVVHAEAYSLGQPGSSDPDLGYPNTFIFGFSSNSIPNTDGLAISRYFPKRGGNTGNVSIAIYGTGFTLNSLVELICNSNSVSLAPYEMIVNDTGTEIVAEFDMADLEAGECNLKVSNSSDEYHQMMSAFSIEDTKDAEEIWFEITGRNRIRASRTNSYSISYGNKGDVNAEAKVLVLSTSNGASLRLNSDKEYQDKPLRILAPGTNGQLLPGVGYTINAMVIAEDDDILRLSQLDTTGDFDWQSVSDIKPTDTEWQSLVENAKPNIGNTWSDILKKMSSITQNSSWKSNALYDFDELLRYLVAVYGSEIEDMKYGTEIDPENIDTDSPYSNIDDVDGVSIITYQKSDNANHSYIITHGLGGTVYDERYKKLADSIKDGKGDGVSIFLVDWSVLADESIKINERNVPNPWAAKSRIELVGNIVFERIAHEINPFKATLIGEGFGNYINHQIAKRYDNEKNEEMKNIIALNPTNEYGGYEPPNFEAYSASSIVYHTESLWDTVKEAGTLDILLNVPTSTTTIEKHLWGLQWLNKQIEKNDWKWVEPNEILNDFSQNTDHRYYDVVLDDEGNTVNHEVPRYQWPVFAPNWPVLLTPHDQHPVTIVTSMDPNDKIGPMGVGDSHEIERDDALNYIVYFENKKDAEAPAQEVYIRDQLDTRIFDFETLSLGQMSFGDNLVAPPPGLDRYETEIDLRPGKNLIVTIEVELHPATGMLSWYLRCYDPDTGDWPEDPMVGFLPPNTAPPNGEGFVSFSIKPKEDLPTETEIHNMADIVFDTNEPIETPEWFNTITDEIVNIPPSADAGEDQTVEMVSTFGAEVMLDGSQSFDEEGCSLMYVWSWDTGTATGITPTIELPYGENEVTLTVSDGKDTDTDTVIVTVTDSTAPNVYITAPLVSEEVQGDVRFSASATDLNGVREVVFYIRSADMGQTDYIELPATYNYENLEWESLYNTSNLQDGYYVVMALAVDKYGNESGSIDEPLAIHNWTVTKKMAPDFMNQAGHIIPVQFSIQTDGFVDEDQSFIYNEALEIRIFDKFDTETPRQIASYGPGKDGYQIDLFNERYIAEFAASHNSATYVVHIVKTNDEFLIGSFEFKVFHRVVPGWLYGQRYPLNIWRSHFGYPMGWGTLGAFGRRCILQSVPRTFWVSPFDRAQCRHRRRFSPWLIQSICQK